MTGSGPLPGLHNAFASLDPEPLLASPPALIEFLPIAVYACDSARGVRWFNARAAELWGRAPAIGETAAPFAEAVTVIDGLGGMIPADGECPMAHALRTGESVDGRAILIERSDGSRIAATVHITALVDSARNVVGAVTCLHEVTEPMRKDRAALQSERRQREMLFEELNHRIKNNMQMLQALLAAARRETEGEDARQALDEASRRVAAIAAAQTALYQSDDLDRFDSADFMTSVCAAALDAFGDSVRLELDVRAGWLANDSAVPLALILNELVSNAAKYGGDDEGRSTIRVALTEADGSFVLAVGDDGPGFDLCAVRKASGVGLVAGLARQMGGSFRVERRGGALCVVEFPARPARRVEP